jgi:hypothetical protein
VRADEKLTAFIELEFAILCSLTNVSLEKKLG